MRITLSILALLFLTLGGLSFWFTQSEPDVRDLSDFNDTSDNHVSAPAPEVIVDNQSVVRAEITSNDTVKLRREQEILQSLPRSLRGTDINGGFEVGPDGHLILSKANKDFFEYFLSTLGEESLEQVIDRMVALIEFRLESPAKEEAVQLLNNYIALKRALLDLEQEVGEGLSQYGDSPLAQHRARLDMLSSLRTQYLGDEAASAFFGENEDFDRYMLDKMALNGNTELSDLERSEALVKLMEDAPESIKPRLEDDYQMQKLNVEVASLKASGASDEEVFQARAQVLGEDAATRLQQVETAQAQWDSRYQDYLDQKAEIESEGLSEAAQIDQIESLQTRLFEDNEIRRVQALDRIKGS